MLSWSQAGSWVVNRGCNWIGMGMLRATMRYEEMWWDEMRCDEMRYDVMRWDAMWWDAIWWDVMRCDMMRCLEMWSDAMPWDVMRSGPRWDAIQDVMQSKMWSFTGACAYYPIIGCWNLAELLEGWGRVL